MSERVFGIRTILVAAVMLIVARTYYLTIVCHDELIEKADRQNTVNISVADKRNDFLDRYNRHITGLEKKGYIAIFSSNDEKVDMKNCEFLECFTKETAEEIFERLTVQKKTYVQTNIDFNEYDIEKIKYVKPFYAATRYLSDYPAASLIGYISDGKGVYGLEKVYDEILINENSQAFVKTDAFRNVIGNINLVSNNEQNFKIKLTLDLQLQRIVEKALENSEHKCSAVLMDVNNFDILAMASYPDFEQDNIAKFLNYDSGVLQNNSMLSYDMGSIFKIVVAAAAIENNILDENKLYNCYGKIDVSGKTFECHNLYGHGTQTIYDAFKNSCNCAFIELGQETGFENILNMAKKFRLGERRLLPAELEQQAGSLPDENNYYMADLANLSIGQGMLSGTVLDGASISAVIASGGYICNVNCVDSVTDSYGQLIKTLRNDKKERIISKETADVIKKMMLLTNKEGTGTSAQLQTGGSGGKTGSAQTGWYVNGENYQHGWFTGFFPADNPMYALCVFVENGKSGSETAAPIFKEIGDKVMSLL